MVYASGAAGFVVVLANGATYPFSTLNDAIRQAIKLEMAFDKVVAINTPTEALEGANLRKLIGEEPEPGYWPFPMGGPSAARNPLAAAEYRKRKAETLADMKKPCREAIELPTNRIDRGAEARCQHL